MTIPVTISIGYINVPFSIKSSTRALTTEEEKQDDYKKPFWTFNNTICTSCFVTSPPNTYPTIEKHVLELAPNTTPVEKQTSSILSHALNQLQPPFNKKSHGLIALSKDLVGILTATTQYNVFTLQIVQYANAINASAVKELLASTNDSSQKEKAAAAATQLNLQSEKSYQNNSSSDLLACDLDCLVKPVAIMELCQHWPTTRPQLVKLASQAYQSASLYGYWDYWRVFEGVCNTHQIDPQHLINTNGQQ